MDSVEMLDMAGFTSWGGKSESLRFHHTTQNSALFKTDELFISIYYFWTLVDVVTETRERETVAKGRLLYRQVPHVILRV